MTLAVHSNPMVLGFYPSLDRFHKVQNLHVGKVCKSTHNSIFTTTGPPGFKYRNRSVVKVPYQVPSGFSPKSMEPFTRKHARSVPNQMMNSLRWWTIPENVCKGLSICLPDPQVLTANASLTGWRAHQGNRTVQGTWNPMRKEPEH